LTEVPHMPWGGAPGRRRRRWVQLRFGFVERAFERERWFKRAIVALTAIAIIGMLAAEPRWRFYAVSLPQKWRWHAERAAGLEPGREAIDAYWRAKRALDTAQTERVFRRVYAEADPALRALLDAAGMSADEALLRPGNFDRVLLLSSRVFAPDEHGRSYRMRPKTRSFWLRKITLPDGLAAMFLVPDTAEVQSALANSRALVVPESVQFTNSWGFRGPEPNPKATVRGLVLGDSFMQGMLVGEADTPPARLQRDLEKRLGKDVSILNTGHLGYSIDQYYFTLREYGDQFAPHFVVLSLFANDFGDTREVLQGKGDWKEGEYWLSQIQRYCDIRNIPLVVTPVPIVEQVVGRRQQNRYQGRIAEIFPYSSLHFVDPLDDFVSEHLRLVNEGAKRGARPYESPLFLGKYQDGHFSAAGSEVWAQALGRRLALLFERQERLGLARP
jgi:hypothetical protein